LYEGGNWGMDAAHHDPYARTKKDVRNACAAVGLPYSLVEYFREHGNRCVRFMTRGVAGLSPSQKVVIMDVQNWHIQSLGETM